MLFSPQNPRMEDSITVCLSIVYPKHHNIREATKAPKLQFSAVNKCPRFFNLKEQMYFANFRVCYRAY